MHPGIMVQFELDLNHGDSALSCMECSRPKVPDSKHLGRIPPKLHPPLACGMTIFGSSNSFMEVKELADRHGVVLVILLRLNHVAHAISSYRHFRPKPREMQGQVIAVPGQRGEDMRYVPWGAEDLARAVHEQRLSYARLLQFPKSTERPAHFIFYEDLKQNPREVWLGLQEFLGIPKMDIDGLESLERKATDRPSIHYLLEIEKLQQELRDKDWGDMLLNPDFDKFVNVTEAFQEVCELNPNVGVSWRTHRCRDGALIQI